MSLFLSRIVRYATRRIASDPQARAAVSKSVQGIADEVKLIARDKDRARAAGKAMRRTIGKLRGSR